MGGRDPAAAPSLVGRDRLLADLLVGRRFTLAMIFQLAHCVDSAEFAIPDAPRRGEDFELQPTACTRTSGRRCVPTLTGSSC
jgi:hypothetical protein